MPNNCLCRVSLGKVDEQDGFILHSVKGSVNLTVMGASCQ